MSETDSHFQPMPVEDSRAGVVVQERYKLIKKMGEGGMGAVYEGEHLLIRKRVAIKCLHPELARNPELVARFHREALAATAIGHQNIIEVTDMGQFPDGAVYMVLEFLDGRDWAADIEATGPQPLKKVVHIMTQVCDALDAAHEKGITHRDLKPENIFLIKRGADHCFAKLLDFGISKIKEEMADGKGITQTGMALGTPYYMPPEQAHAKKDIDYRADIYALGVILFEALTGHRPFEAPSLPLLFIKICNDSPPPIRQYRPDMPEAMEGIIGKLLAKEPGQRYQSCSEVAAALAPYGSIDAEPVVAIPPSDEASDGVGTAPTIASDAALSMPGDSGLSTSTPAVAVDAPPRRSRTGLIVAIVALIVVVFGVGGSLAAVLTSTSSGDGERQLGVVEPQPPPREPPSTPPATEEVPRPPEKGSTPAESRVAAEETPTKMVTVRINTEPEEAELFLDGNPIPNPFDGELPSTVEPRSLEARLGGYRTYFQELSLQYPQRVRIRLKRGEGTDDRRTERTKTRASVTAKAPALTGTGSDPAPPTPAPEATDPAPAKTTPADTPAEATKARDLKRITL